MKNDKLLKIAVFVALLIGSIAVYLNIEFLQVFIKENETLSWLVYLLAWVILPIFLFPVPLLAVIGGLIFDMYFAVFLTMVGAMINSIIMYEIGKIFTKEKTKIKIEDSFMGVFILRLIPLVPYNLLNYSCGFLKIEYKNYILASFVGIFPGTIILINLGKNVLHVGSSEFYWSVFWLVLLVVLSLLAKKWHTRLSS